MTATGSRREPRSLSSQKTDPRGERTGLLISGIKSRKYEYLPLQSKPLCTTKFRLFSSVILVLISLGRAELLSGSGTELWLHVSPQQQKDTAHDRADRGLQITLQIVWALRAMLSPPPGFYDHHAINKASKDKNLYHCAPLQAPVDVKRKVRRGSQRVAGCCSCFFYDYHAGRLVQS